MSKVNDGMNCVWEDQDLDHLVVPLDFKIYHDQVNSIFATSEGQPVAKLPRWAYNSQD